MMICWRTGSILCRSCEGKHGCWEREYSLTMSKRLCFMSLLPVLLSSHSLSIFSLMCVCVMMCLWVHEPLHVCGSQRTTWGTWFFPTFLWFLGIKLSSPGLYSKYLPAKSPCYPLTPAFPLSTPSSSAVPSGGGDRDVFCRREHSTEALLLVLWPVMSLCMNHLGAHSKSLCGIFCRGVK